MQSHSAHKADIKRFIRFAVVGVLNTAFGYTVYLVLLWTGLPYYAAWGGALVLALLFGFYMSGTFVFGSAKTGRIPLYFLSWSAIYLMNIAALKPLIGFGIAEEIAPLIILPVNVLASYLVQKHIVFR